MAAAAIDNLIRISISQVQSTVTTATTTIPLILGGTAPTSWDDGDVVHTYFSAADLLDDGFTEESPEYVYANLLCGQSTVPAQFLVAARAGANITEDLNDIIAADNSWYALVIPEATDAEIQEAAAWIEPQKKIFIAASKTPAIADATSTTDVGSVLKSKGYTRTALIFSPGSADKGIEAAWVGGQLPKIAGSDTWALQTLAGISTDSLTPSQQSVCFGNPAAGLVGRNVNVYQSVSGARIMQMGTMAAGNFIDQRVGTDALIFDMQTRILARISNGQGKVPQTNQGVAVLAGIVRASIDQSAVNKFIDPKQPIVVTAADISTLTQAQRQTRQAPLITFSAVPQGAIHAVNVVGIEGAVVP